MIRINLLPQEERTVKTRRASAVGWAVYPGAAAAALVASAVLITAMQTSRNRSLEKDIAAAEKQTASLAPQIARISDLARERADMDLRISLIRRLEAGRYVRVQMLDELSRQLPDHVWLTAAREAPPGKVTVEGVTFSNLMVSDFMQRLEASPLYENVDLVVTQKGTIEDRDVTKFTLTAQVSGDLGVTAKPAAPKQTVRRRES